MFRLTECLRVLILVDDPASCLQVLKEIFAAKSPLYLAALQVAAMQLRSLILADELLQSVCVPCTKQSTDGSQGSPSGEERVFPGKLDFPPVSVPLTPETAWSAANIEAEEQRRRFGVVQGSHDVEKAESLMWLHAAALTAALG